MLFSLSQNEPAMVQLWPIRVAAPSAIIRHARAAPDFGQPNIKHMRIAQRHHHADQVNGDRDQQHPECLEDDEEFGGDDTVYDSEAKGYAEQELRAS